MSEKEMEVLETELQQEQEIEEAKASLGDPSEVPDPSTKEVPAPGGEKDQGEKKGAKATSPTQVPKTKVAMLQAAMAHLQSMKKGDLQMAYEKMFFHS